MTTSLKQIFTEKSLWKWLLMSFKYYIICYLLILIPMAMIRWSLYFSGNINSSQLWNLLVYTYSILIGIIWCYFNNKSTMSMDINHGKRRNEFRDKIIASIVAGTVGFLFLTIINEIYFIRNFPQQMLYSIVNFIYDYNFPSDLLDNTFSIWFGTMDIFSIYIMFNIVLIFTSYNTMKYLFDKSILA